MWRHYVVTFIETARVRYVCTSFQFACCGINGSSNYGTSWWRLQEVGRRELVVPFSCCILNNANETDSFLNPIPDNLTLCQTLNPAEHQYARHTEVDIVTRKFCFITMFLCRCAKLFKSILTRQSYPASISTETEASTSVSVYGNMGLYDSHIRMLFLLLIRKYIIA